MPRSFALFDQTAPLAAWLAAHLPTQSTAHLPAQSPAHLPADDTPSA